MWILLVCYSPPGATAVLVTVTSKGDGSAMGTPVWLGVILSHAASGAPLDLPRAEATSKHTNKAVTEIII